MIGAERPLAELDCGAIRPRVLLVTPQPFFRFAGTPMNVRLMCQALAELGFAVDLLTFPFGEDMALPHVRQSRVWPIRGLRDIPIGFSLSKIAYDVLLAGLVLGKLARHRYVAVHAIEEAAFFALPLAWLRGTPRIMDLDSDLEHQLRSHGSRFARALAPAARTIRRLVLRRSTAAVTVAGHLTELVRRECPTIAVFEIRDIPLAEALEPVDEGVVADLRRELALGPGPIAVYTGNFDRRQGLVELLQGWRLVRRNRPTAELVVVGGSAASVAELRARHLGDGGDGAGVVFTGTRPPAEMPAFMALADALVSPRLEPLVTPFKIYTYMASGRPIVATALPTHQEVLDESTAFLVEPTPAGLAGGLGAAFEAPEEAARRARAARALIDSHHNYHVFKRRIGQLYAGIGGIAGAGAAATVPLGSND